MSDIRFFLNVCETMQEDVELAGVRYKAGHQGEIELKHSINNDVLYLDMAWCGHHPHVGGAAHISSISIRVCPKNISTIAIYDDPLMNSMGCCFSCANGCSVYGNSDCGCE